MALTRRLHYAEHRVRSDGTYDWIYRTGGSWEDRRSDGAHDWIHRINVMYEYDQITRERASYPKWGSQGE